MQLSGNAVDNFFFDLELDMVSLDGIWMDAEANALRNNLTNITFAALDGGLNYLCPIVVERKSVQDVAMSIHDGRWKDQKRRMYHAQYVFGYDNCHMVYIIEGNENAQTVSGGYVGARWFNVDNPGKLFKIGS